MNLDKYLSLAATYALPLLGAVLIILIGFRIAKAIGSGFETSLNKAPNSDPSLSRFFASFVKFLLMLVVALAALSVLGVDTSSVTGMILASGAALAFVMQGSLSNLAAGVMLLLFRPFSQGDDVEVNGVKGTVLSIELTATRLKTADNVELIVANSSVWGGTIKNFTSMGARRLDRNFGISYDGDIEKAIQTITEAAASNPRVHTDPAPWAKVVNLGDSSVDIQLRAWCNASDYKALTTEISKPVKQALDAAGISIPYPHEVKIKQHVKTSKGRDRIARLKSLREKNS